ncbi:MAG: COX15/CtaA family protein [Trueperaceae bacterium]
MSDTVSSVLPRSPILAAHLPERRRRHLRIWLWSGAALTFAILVVGGITRLTQSGLSIVEWAPLVGVIPPLNEAQWEAAFAQYQRYPEYQQLRPDMTLAEYKTIFFWEYVHRLLARIIGVVFLVPFGLFWARGYLRSPLTKRLLVLFGLGALQGFMGWFMVASGLVDRPSVAHERLAAHLVLAFSIFAVCVWTAADLLPRPSRSRATKPSAADAGRAGILRGWLVAFGVLFGIQVVYGAFVAGLDAGFAFNTYPLMAGSWLPPAAWHLEPAIRNLIDNIATVQWIHRTLPVLLLVVSLVLVARSSRSGQGSGFEPNDVGWAATLLALVLVQAALGIATLVLFVPTWLAVLHQAVALALFGAWLSWLHRLTWRVHDAFTVPMKIYADPDRV